MNGCAPTKKNPAIISIYLVSMLIVYTWQETEYDRRSPAFKRKKKREASMSPASLTSTKPPVKWRRHYAGLARRPFCGDVIVFMSSRRLQNNAAPPSAGEKRVFLWVNLCRFALRISHSTMAIAKTSIVGPRLCMAINVRFSKMFECVCFKDYSTTFVALKYCI